MKTKNFIVPHDFTPVANIALEHAVATAKPLDAEIYLLHVVAKNKDIGVAEKKLEAVISNYDTSVKIIPSVRVGNIFEDIGDFAAEHHAELIFMGTPWNTRLAAPYRNERIEGNYTFFCSFCLSCRKRHLKKQGTMISLFP